MKLLSVAVPCYNSAAYMEKCIASVLAGGEDVEIIIVDDGSSDDTPRIADRIREEHPDTVKVVHKKNGGHGSAVNAGLEEASGIFFKVVDSDDWLRTDAFLETLKTLRQFVGAGSHLDMLVCNYVYNKAGEKKKKVIRYRGLFPEGRLFAWKDAGLFLKGRYLLMHSVIFRTRLLKDIGLRLPEHCFYVDNLYVFQPLPYVRNIYYLDADLYSYSIGRDDQSVNEKVMISRLDQQIRVNRLMFDYYSDRAVREALDRNRKCRACMYNYLEIVTAVSSVLALCSGTKEDLAKKAELWKYMRERDRNLYRKLRRGVLGVFVNLPGKGARALTVRGYRLARLLFKFN